MIRNRIQLRSGWLLAALVVVAGVPFLVGADDPAERAANRKAIAEMSPHEREELQENYTEFRSLPESEREEYRRLHAEVEGNSQLRGIFNEYQDWLRTLTPYQRLELRNETDWSRRLDLVRRMREDQQAEQERRRNEERNRRPAWRPMVWLAHNPRLLPRLESRDLAAVMKIIRDTIPAKDFDQRLQGLSDPVRYTRVLTAALQDAIEQSGLPESSQGSLEWPDQRLMDRILDVISSEDDLERFEQLRSSEDVLPGADPEGRRLLLAIIINSIDTRWWWEAWKTEPSRDDITRLLNAQDEEKRTQIQLQSAPERKGAIQFLFVTERRRQFWDQEAFELVRHFEAMWPAPADFPPRPGPGAFGFGPRGDRRPGEHRGPGGERRAPDEERRKTGEERREGAPPSPDTQNN